MPTSIDTVMYVPTGTSNSFATYRETPSVSTTVDNNSIFEIAMMERNFDPLLRTSPQVLEVEASYFNMTKDFLGFYDNNNRLIMAMLPYNIFYVKKVNNV